MVHLMFDFVTIPSFPKVKIDLSNVLLVFLSILTTYCAFKVADDFFNSNTLFLEIKMPLAISILLASVVGFGIGLVLNKLLP